MFENTEKRETTNSFIKIDDDSKIISSYHHTCKGVTSDDFQFSIMDAISLFDDDQNSIQLSIMDAISLFDDDEKSV
jgi:hypothetical protein